jgi:folate-dependent phosphoribosylglycinamide formyltransferase PurN
MAGIMGIKKRILVFASGDAEGGGSGFQEMVEQSRTNPPILDAQIVGVISNYASGGVFKKAQALNVPFEHWTGPFNAEMYQALVEKYKADFAMCSGWLKPVEGLESAKTINIHPGPLNYSNTELHFGGKGMWGHHVHEAVMKAYGEGRLVQSAVTMHFVTPYSADGYDRGPVFFQMPVLIRPDDTPDTLAKRVNEKERAWQSKVLNMVVNGHIFLHEGSVRYTDHFCKKIFYGIF